MTAPSPNAQVVRDPEILREPARLIDGRIPGPWSLSDREAIEREVRAANLPRLMAIAATIQKAIAGSSK